MKLSDVRPNDWNPNRMSEAAFAEYVGEVKHLGKPPKPLILRANHAGYEIVDGEHSYRALLELGYEEMPDAWYTVEEYDDFEAMRQTYKRNQHGTHDPLAQGRLFKRMMTERGLSKRQLAEAMEVSEGTVRNSLEYVKAAGMRDDYAFSDLTVDQVRTYNRLPKPFGDVWLATGFSERLMLWTYSDADYRKRGEYQVGPDDWSITTAQKMIDAGLAEWFPEGYAGGGERAAAKLRELYDFYQMEARFCHDDVTHGFLRPYTVHFLSKKWPVREERMMRKALKNLMREDDGKITMIATPEEFSEWVEGSKTVHSLDEMIALRRVDLGLDPEGADVEGKLTAAKIRSLHPIPEIEQALADAMSQRYIPQLRLDALLELARLQPIDNQFSEIKQTEHLDEFRNAVVTACSCIAKKPQKHWPWTQEHRPLRVWIEKAVERLVEQKVIVLKSDYELLMEIRAVLGDEENIEPLAGLSRHALEELCNALWVVRDRRAFFEAISAMGAALRA